jgi:hypothetical protein
MARLGGCPPHRVDRASLAIFALERCFQVGITDWRVLAHRGQGGVQRRIPNLTTVDRAARRYFLQQAGTYRMGLRQVDMPQQPAPRLQEANR